LRADWAEVDLAALMPNGWFYRLERSDQAVAFRRLKRKNEFPMVVYCDFLGVNDDGKHI